MTEKILEHLLEARKLLADVQDVKENRHAMGFLDEAIKWQREVIKKQIPAPPKSQDPRILTSEK